MSTIKTLIGKYEQAQQKTAEAIENISHSVAIFIRDHAPQLDNEDNPAYVNAFRDGDITLHLSQDGNFSFPAEDAAKSLPQLLAALAGCADESPALPILEMISAEVGDVFAALDGERAAQQWATKTTVDAFMDHLVAGDFECQAGASLTEWATGPREGAPFVRLTVTFTGMQRKTGCSHRSISVYACRVEDAAAAAAVVHRFAGFEETNAINGIRLAVKALNDAALKRDFTPEPAPSPPAAPSPA